MFVIIVAGVGKPRHVQGDMHPHAAGVRAKYMNATNGYV